VDLTVVVPTQNEEANVAPLVARSCAALAPLGLRWEMVFVDDSDDATPLRVLEAAELGKPVRLLHRQRNDRIAGLGGAVALGFATAARSEIVAVMDGDLQHRPEMLVPLVEAVVQGGADLAIASRRALLASPTGGIQRWWRCSVSRTSRSIVQLLLPRLAAVGDPLAGFFAMRRDVIDGVDLRPEGFKILLEVLVRGSWSTVVEIPSELDRRLHGQSKAHLDEGLAFGRHLIRLLLAESKAPRRRVEVTGVCSGQAVERPHDREVLGDHDHRPSPGQAPVGPKGEEGQRLGVEVPCVLPELLLSRRQDLPEGLETVLAKELADRGRRRHQTVHHPRAEASEAHHGLRREDPAGLTVPKEHLAAEYEPLAADLEVSDVGGGRDHGLAQLRDLNGLARVLLEDPADGFVRGEHDPL
jgi:hypothetical protein